MEDKIKFIRDGYSVELELISMKTDGQLLRVEAISQGAIAQVYQKDFFSAEIEKSTEYFLRTADQLLIFLQAALKNTEKTGIIVKKVGEEIELQCRYDDIIGPRKFTLKLEKLPVDKLYLIEKSIENLKHEITIQSQGGTSTLELKNGWANYGGEYEGAQVTRQGKLVVVSGLIRGGNWGLLAQLPPDCCPKQRLIFNCNNHVSSARVDVLPSGEIHWVIGGKDHGWVSLSGINFTAK